MIKKTIKLILLLYLVIFSSLLQAKEGCPFCSKDVLDKQVSLYGDKSFVLVNISPVDFGHVMVIPKRHITSFNEVTSEELIEIGDLLKKAANSVKQIYNIDNYIIIQKNGENTSRSQEHVHFHILPIKTTHEPAIKSAFHLDPSIPRKKLSSLELANEVKKFKEVLAKMQ